MTYKKHRPSQHNTLILCQYYLIFRLRLSQREIIRGKKSFLLPISITLNNGNLTINDIYFIKTQNKDQKETELKLSNITDIN